MADLVSAATNASPVVVIVASFLMYLQYRDKRDQKTHEGYQKHIAALAEKISDHSSSLQSLYKYSVSREELIVKYDETIKKLAELVDRYETYFQKVTGRKSSRPPVA